MGEKAATNEVISKLLNALGDQRLYQMDENTINSSLYWRQIEHSKLKRLNN
jgi:hypothetical protein